jgi:hypothetical protein
LRSVHDQKTSGLACKSGQSEEQDEGYPDSHAARMLLRKSGFGRIAITRVTTRLGHIVKIPQKAPVPQLEPRRSMLEFCLDL